MTTRYISVIALFCIVTATAFAQSIPSIDAWSTDLSKPGPSAKSIYITRGESRYIQPTVTYSGPWQFPTNAAVVMRYRSSDMTGGFYYAVTGSVYNATSGVLRILWTPAQEANAKAYSFEIEAATGTTAQIALSGSIFLRDSLATLASATNPLVKATIDWNAVSNVNVTNGPWTAVNADATARTAASNAQNTANAATNWIATNTLYASATNSAYQAAKTLTNGLASAESVTAVNVSATNALALINAEIAAGRIDATVGSNIAAAVTATFASTGNVASATTAGAIRGTNGDWTISFDGNGLVAIQVTNTLSVYVSATNGLGYNGPPIGTTWTNAHKVDTYWTWGLVDGIELFSAVEADLNVYDARDFQIANGDAHWYFIGGVPPATLYPIIDPAAGFITIKWVPATNLYSLGVDSYARTQISNLTASMSFTNGVLNGTNSAVHSANGTNWHILFY